MNKGKRDSILDYAYIYNPCSRHKSGFFLTIFYLPRKSSFNKMDLSRARQLEPEKLIPLFTM